jgi:hypothetical protein
MEEIQQGSDYSMNGTHATRHWISWIGLKIIDHLISNYFWRENNLGCSSRN